MELRGKVALVTGVGRQEGIGTAICRELARQGTNVFFTYWHPYDAALFPGTAREQPASLGDELRNEGVRAASIELDLSRADASDELFRAATDALGTPDILINNACYSTNQPLASMTAELLDAHYAVNVRAPALLCKAFIEAHVGGEGRIISLTSGQSLGVMPGELPYTITKAALDMLTMQLAPLCAAQGVRINAVDPGPVDTGWMSDAVRGEVVRDSETGKVTSPEDAAEFIRAMLMDDSLYENGEIVHAFRKVH